MRRALTLLASLVLLAGGVAVAAPTATASTEYPVPYNFLPAAVLGGLQTDAPGSNDWSCKPSAAHPRPVVLVHGTAGNKATNWQTYAPLLANNGYCVYALTYGALPGQELFGGFAPMEESAQQLAEFIDRVRSSTGAAQVDLVGHSQGTLMPNYYAKFLGGAKYIHAYISLAPVWHGTNRAAIVTQLARAFGIAESEMPVCAACAQFGTGSAFLAKMRAGGTAVPGIAYTNIVTKYDELVGPYTSGIEPGMTNIVLQDRCALDFGEHFAIAADPVAAGHVLNALDPAHPRPVSCQLVLPFVASLF